MSETGTDFSTRLHDFAKSELFNKTFREGMDLVEETAAYLDGPGREESRALTRTAALAYAGESMRLTTSLMQVASWLLVQRALRDNDMSIEDARAEKYRIGKGLVRKSFAGIEELPETLSSLIARATRVFERIKRLDQQLYVEAEDNSGANAVSEQMDRLNAAFGRP